MVCIYIFGLTPLVALANSDCFNSDFDLQFQVIQRPLATGTALKSRPPRHGNFDIEEVRLRLVVFTDT